jgi:hypothetical protein
MTPPDCQRETEMALQGRHMPLGAIGNPRGVAACQAYRREGLQGDNGFRIEYSCGATHVVPLLSLLNCSLPRFLGRGEVSVMLSWVAWQKVSSLALPGMKIPCSGTPLTCDDWPACVLPQG